MKKTSLTFLLIALCSLSTSLVAEDNALSKSEKNDGWILLFNGKDFTDWKIDKWNPDCFTIEDGAIRCHGKPSMIYHTGEAKNVKDFHFVADVMTKPGANGGIFFHTKYQELQH